MEIEIIIKAHGIKSHHVSLKYKEYFSSGKLSKTKISGISVMNTKMKQIKSSFVKYEEIKL
jgi:hypothetical protein